MRHNLIHGTTQFRIAIKSDPETLARLKRVRNPQKGVYERGYQGIRKRNTRKDLETNLSLLQYKRADEAAQFDDSACEQEATCLQASGLDYPYPLPMKLTRSQMDSINRGFVSHRISFQLQGENTRRRRYEMGYSRFRFTGSACNTSCLPLQSPTTTKRWMAALQV